MIWFQRLFPVVMIAAPLAITLLVPVSRRYAGPDAGERTRRLAAWTLALLVVFAAVQAVLEGLLPAGARGVPGWPTLAALGGFMLLWFRHALPAMGVRDPGWRPRAPAEIPREPPPGADPELVEAFARYARLRRTAWIAGGVLALAVVALGVVLAVTRDGRIVGLAGGLLGGAFGVTGAVFGVVADFRRARIRRMLYERQESGKGPAPDGGRGPTPGGGPWHPGRTLF